MSEKKQHEQSEYKRKAEEILEVFTYKGISGPTKIMWSKETRTIIADKFAVALAAEREKVTAEKDREIGKLKGKITSLESLLMERMDLIKKLDGRWNGDEQRWEFLFYRREEGPIFLPVMEWKSRRLRSAEGIESLKAKHEKVLRHPKGG